MKKILIIGSKGFIGSHCLSLLGDRYEVYGCDVIVDYNSENYYLLDSSNPNFNELFLSNEFDFCINCSGAASVPDSLKNPLRDFQLNTANVVKILDAIRKYSPECKFLNLSSAAVYGNPERLPLYEAAKTDPISPYGIHKKMAEMICSEYAFNFGIKTVSIRVFSAYGEGLKKQLFWDLHKKARQSNSIHLFGTGNESRDYIYISDLVKLLACVMDNHDFKGDSINASSGIETTIKVAANTFFENYHNSNLKIDFSGETRSGDPSNWLADISIANSLGFEPKVNLNEGLKKYCKWLKDLE